MVQISFSDAKHFDICSFNNRNLKTFNCPQNDTHFLCTSKLFKKKNYKQEK